MLLIKHFREQAGLTQLDMAEKLKIGIRSYQRYESCNSIPTIDFLFHTSALLGVNVKELISPQDSLSSIGEISFFRKDQLDEFLQCSGEDLRDLFNILNSPSFNQAITKNRLSILKANTSFMYSPDALSLSNIKTTLLNPAAQLEFGCSTDTIPTSSFHCNPKHVGILWGALLQGMPSYFTMEKCLDTPAGKKKLHTNNAFLSLNNNYYILRKMRLTPYS